jgi:hypothetical protein
MKRILIAASILLMIFILSFSLISCSQDSESFKIVDLDAITQDISSAVQISMPTELDAQTLQELFDLEPDQVEKYSGIFSMSMTSADTFVAVMAKEGNTVLIQEAFDKRIEDIKDSFVKNLDIEYEKVQNAKIIVKDDYVFLIISNDNKEIQNIIDKYF